jgi:hypothetical protein
MRLTNIASGRPAYYDRNPTTKALAFRGASIAPHTGTSRFSYTVPTGRKFIGTAGGIAIVRDAVATTVGALQADLDVFPSGGVFTNVLTLVIWSIALDSHREVSVAGFTLLAGDALQAFTLDTNVGGTASYSIGAQGIEFDA